MNRLEFNNLTVIYDIGYRGINKIKLIRALSVTFDIAMLIIAIALGMILENFLISGLLAFTLVIFTNKAVCEVLNKISHNHYEVILRLLRMNKEAIEVRWFNNRYAALVHSHDYDWRWTDLEDLLKTSNYELHDRAYKDKPIHMTLDMSEEIIKITCENK